MNTLNPFQVFEDLIPPKARKYIVYGVLPVVVFAYGIWQASDGNWKVFWPALGAALMGMIANPNTHAEDDSGDDFVEYDDSDIEDFEEQPDPESPAPVATPEESGQAIDNAAGEWDVNEGEKF